MVTAAVQAAAARALPQRASRRRYGEWNNAARIAAQASGVRKGLKSRYRKYASNSTVE